MPRNAITSDRPIVFTERANAIRQTRGSSALPLINILDLARSGPGEVPAACAARPFLARSSGLQRRRDADAARAKLPIRSGTLSSRRCRRGTSARACTATATCVEVVIEGEIDPERGWVMDFAEIDEHAAAAGPAARSPGPQRDRGPGEPDERAARGVVVAAGWPPGFRALRGGRFGDPDLALRLPRRVTR